MTPAPTAAAPGPAPELLDALDAWYAAHRRDLPWRAEPGRPPDPYAVWVSEIMLQQTQVATVRPYYAAWMARFPTVEALAAAEREAVLALWQGLGYYARARNLHAAARRLVAERGGRLPADPAALRALPGIGDYSAGAIAAIAFGIPAPAVDGNVRRLLARLDAVEGDPTRGQARARIRRRAEQLVQGPAPGDRVQALIELGATVCRPRRPDCPTCPLSPWCRARAAGRQAELPAASPRARPREAHAFAYALIHPHSGQWLLARRTETGLLGGLWELPQIEAEPEADPVALLRETFGLTLAEPRRAAAVSHVFSHVRLRATPVIGWTEARAPAGRADARYAEWRWLQPLALHGAALPTATLTNKLVAAVEAALEAAG